MKNSTLKKVICLFLLLSLAPITIVYFLLNIIFMFLAAIFTAFVGFFGVLTDIPENLKDTMQAPYNMANYCWRTLNKEH